MFLLKASQKSATPIASRLLLSKTSATRGLASLKTSSIYNAKRFYSDSTNSQPKKSNNTMYLAAGAIALGAIGYYTYTKSTKEELTGNKAGPVFNNSEVSVVFVLGGPGSGKGTQCSKLVKEYDFVHLSAGDLLRAEQARPNSEFGELIAKYIREGLIVPQEITLKLLENAIKENYGKGSTRFLIDGFPRKMDQALSFEEQIATSAFTLFFECPEQVMIERIINRGKTSGRTDDNVESLKKRFKTFYETSMPVVDYFDKQGKMVKLSCNKPVDEVYASVKGALSEKLNIN
ncbi:bifunctional uridylate/adenylate kinase [Saccharomycopsis crataegensis]|uniref:Uridylate kinase n=1 Tax=Saccharomycopsis crataegensis TaxID=43959 RepID=A0AAV5QIC6_9ASCO|nr:bifunctional uridylate/adenylate kinase [Saccharomycopsis crataegensis]